MMGIVLDGRKTIHIMDFTGGLRGRECILPIALANGVCGGRGACMGCQFPYQIQFLDLERQLQKDNR